MKNHPAILARSVAALLSVTALIQTSTAQNFWDVNGAAAGLGGTGVWDINPAGTPNWNVASGVGAPFVWPNTATSDAVFTGVAGTVTVSEPGVIVRNMTFDVDGYSIDGVNGLDLVAAGSIVTVTNLFDTATINAPLTGFGTLTKAGLGTLTLSNPLSTYSGSTNLDAGQLNINADSDSGPLTAGPLGTGILFIGHGTTIGETNGFHIFNNGISVLGDFDVNPFNGLEASGAVALNGGTTHVINNLSGFSFDFTGPISEVFGVAGLTFSGLTNTILGGGADNSYAGVTTVLGGTLFLGKTGGAIAIPGDLVIDPLATVVFHPFGGNQQIASTSNVRVGGLLDLNGFDQQINGLAGGGDIELDGLGGAGTITVAGGFYGGVISDAGLGGRLVKVGPGPLTLTGVNTYIGETRITGGSLFVDGSLDSEIVVVQSGGLLGGKGKVFGHVDNGGFVSPGASYYSYSGTGYQYQFKDGYSIGKLRIGGDYTQGGGGTLVIEIEGADEHDVLEVNGRANLDGSLRLVGVEGPRLKLGDKVTFLTAGQGVSGTFGNVDNELTTGTIIDLELLYEPNAVSLVAVQGSFADFASRNGLTPNQRSVAAMLDDVAFDKREAKLIGSLNWEPLGNLPHDFDLIAPEELTAIYNIGVSLANVQSANLQRRTGDIRAGSEGFSSAGYSVRDSGPGYGGETIYASGARGPEGKGGKELHAPGDGRLGVFITGVGEFSNIGDTGNARGYDLTTGGFTLGADYRITPNFALGVIAGYANTGADLTGNGNVTVNGATFGIYATYFTGTGFYLDAAATGGYNSYETRRGALQGTARGSTDGGQFDALFATGYDWKAGALTIGPTASVEYTYVGLQSFTERGSLAPLSYGSQNVDSLRTSLGMKASYDCHAGGVVIRPEMRAAWQHEFGDSSYAVVSRLASGAGNAFTVNGPQIGDDSMLLGAGVAVLWNERTSTYVYYDGELFRSNFDSHNVSGGVRLAF